MNEFTPLEQFAKLQKPPAIKYKDLEAAVNSTIKYNLLPMKVRADYIPVTGSSVLTNITIQFDAQGFAVQGQRRRLDGDGEPVWPHHDDVAASGDLVRGPGPGAGADRDAAAGDERGPNIYQKTIPSEAGPLPAEHRGQGHGGREHDQLSKWRWTCRTWKTTRCGASSLILADQIEKVPTKNIGVGPFVIGTTKVRPRLGDDFKPDEKLGIYVQLYNFEPDEKTKKPNGTVEYEITKNGSNEKVFDYSEEVASLPGGASQVTVEKILPLKTLAPGSYTLKMKVTDKVRNQTVTPTATFTIT